MKWLRVFFLACFMLIVSVFGKDAPPPKSSTEKELMIKGKDESKDSDDLMSSNLQKKESGNDANSLAEALRVLQRRKREISRTHRPYSSYRPLSAAHRYRYPLYRKRAAYYAPDYYDEDSYGSATDDSNYFDDIQKPSLFRERERGPVPELISNAHFSSKPIYHKRKNPNGASPYPTSKNTHFNLETTPYDLNIMGKLYELGKRGDNPQDLDKSLFVSSDRLGNLSPESGRIGTTHYFPDESKDKAYIEMLKDVSDKSALQSSLIRQKRASVANGFSMYEEIDNNSTTNKSSNNNLMRYNYNGINKATDRQKRAYEDSSIFLSPDEDENDFLTREYFKTIARSVGNKRKRMAYAKFEAQKRSNAIDSFLENPHMLHYVQEQIREAEEEVAKDAENEIRKNSDNEIYPKSELAAQALLSNSIARLNALEKMRESLYQLENIQEQEAIRKRGQDLTGGFSEDEKEKRRKALRGRLIREGQMEEEEERQKRMREDMKKKRREEHEEEDDRRKRKEHALRNLIKGNIRDDCPVLERIVINCIAVTEMVADEDMVFLEPCLRHEVCYMCGSGLDVSRHECDALLSSALEAGCNEIQSIQGRSVGSLDCLSAAGETYKILGDASRYDDKGTCTFDPCVRQLIDSR